MFAAPPPAVADTPRRPTAVDITVVHASACHFCVDAEKALVEVAAKFPQRVRVRLVELESPEGALLTTQHRPGMSPLVLVNGEFFSAGRLPRKKLAALLERNARDDTCPAAG